MLLAPTAAGGGEAGGPHGEGRAFAPPCAPPPRAAEEPAPAAGAEAAEAAPEHESDASAAAPESAGASPDGTSSDGGAADDGGTADASEHASGESPDGTSSDGGSADDGGTADASEHSPDVSPLPGAADDSDDDGFELLPSPPREVIEILDSQPAEEDGAAAARSPAPPASVLGRRQRSPDEAATQCAICLDAVTSDGEHAPVALQCGHVFGRSCVRTWAARFRGATMPCPVCKADVVRGEEIRLFPSTGGVIVVDRSAAEAAQRAAAAAEAAAAAARAELAETQRQLQRLQQQQQQQQGQQRVGAAGVAGPWPGAGAHAAAAPAPTPQEGSAWAPHTLQKTFRVPNLSCCDLLGDTLVAGSAALSPPAPRVFSMQAGGSSLALSLLRLRGASGVPLTRAPDCRVRDVRLGRAPQSRAALALACVPGKLLLLDLAAGGEARSAAMAAQPLCCAWATDGTDQVFVGDEHGAVHVYSVGELERGPLITLAPPSLPFGGRAPCRFIAALPPGAGAGDGLLTLHGSFAACYLVGRPPKAPPVACLVAAAGDSVAGLAWDGRARAAVASRVDAGAVRHTYLAPTLRCDGGTPERLWRGCGDLAAPGMPPPPAAPAAMRTAAVPGAAGEGSLFAAPDASRRAVALWHAPLPLAVEPTARRAAPPVRWLAPHSDGPVLDVRCDAEAHMRDDAAAGRLLLSLSAGELHVHARCGASN